MNEIENNINKKEKVEDKAKLEIILFVIFCYLSWFILLVLFTIFI